MLLYMKGQKEDKNSCADNAMSEQFDEWIMQ